MPQGMLTRRQMEDVIRRGGSVMFHGGTVGGVTETRVIDRIEDLPSEADLAGDDEARRQQARAEIVARRQALDAELAKLEAPPAKATDKPDVTTPNAESATGEPGKPPDYDSWTVEELHAEAAKRDLHGRSGLDKAGLAKALQKADKDAAGEPANRAGQPTHHRGK
jgi:hypothetical protein